MGWKKKLLIGSLSLLFIVVGLGLIFSGSETSESSKISGQITGISEQQSLITSPVDNILPTRNEIPTEFVIDSPEDISASVSASNLEEAKIISTNKIEGSFGAISVSYSVYKFSTLESAQGYYNSVVNDIVQSGGYSEIKLSDSCFGYKEDYGFQAKAGSGICLEKNVVFSVDFSSANTFKNPDDFIKDGIKLLDKKVS